MTFLSYALGFAVLVIIPSVQKWFGVIDADNFGYYPELYQSGKT